MAAKYIDWTIVKGITGLTDTELTSAVKASIENLVEILGIDALFGRDFGMHTIDTSNPELHNIDYEYARTLIVRNFPVISIERLRDNIQDATPTILVEHDDFEVDKRTGMIVLSFDATLGNDVSLHTYFTKGVNTVDVAYTYGFTSVPSDIVAYANMLAAKVCSFWKRLLYSNGIPDYEQMGDYQRRFTNQFNSIDQFYDPIIKNVLFSLKSKYQQLS